MSYIMAGVAVGGLALSAVGTLTSAGAQKQQGQANKQAMDMQAAAAEYEGESKAQILRYEGDVSDFNAKLSDLNAVMDEQAAVRAEGEATAQADIIARSTGRVTGRMTAAYGASGVQSEGSPIAAMHDAVQEGELQKELTLYGGRVTAEGDRYHAILDTATGVTTRAQSTIYRAQATQAQTMGNMAASIYRAGGTAVAQAADAGTGATLLTGLGRTANSAYNLFGSSGSSSTSTSSIKPSTNPIAPYGP